MLSPPEADLIRRDTALPGLATLLDSDLFLAALQPYFPQVQLTAAHPRYIRYKPGMNCLVGYRLEAGRRCLDLYAKAHGSDAEVKLINTSKRRIVPGPLGPGRVVLEDRAVVVSFFPNDSKLKQLAKLDRAAVFEQLLERMGAPGSSVSLETLAYKPERRYVARLTTAAGATAVLKIYTRHAFQRVQFSNEIFRSRGPLSIPRCLAELENFGALALEWLPGPVLTEILTEPQQAIQAVRETGTALAAFHAQKPQGLTVRPRNEEMQTLVALADWLAFVRPPLAQRARHLARHLTAWLNAETEMLCPIHGDFYAKQVLWSEGSVGIVDLDEAALGDPRADLGLFVAHLERDVVRGRLPAASVAILRDALLEGYHCGGGQLSSQGLRQYVAIGLFQLLHGPFRACEPEWELRTEAMLDRVEAMLSGPASFDAHANRKKTPTSSPAVLDPFDAGKDPGMPFLVRALDPLEAASRLAPMLGAKGGRKRPIRLRGIRVVRHKPGRRCLVEYDLAIEGVDGRCQMITLLGKARARGLDTATYRLCQALRAAGFDERSADGVTVPYPVGIISEYRMWFQHKVPGIPATRLMTRKDGISLAKRIAEAIHKLHQTDVSPCRLHAMGDELRILHERLGLLAEMTPRWSKRLERILNACVRLGEAVRAPEPTVIHRDIYPDQVLVDGDRLNLLDFDLCCLGDPGVDIGNFLGHITEQSLRTTGYPDTLRDLEEALEERFLELAGEQFRFNVRVYQTLTLVRHIYISTLFPERQQFTERLLKLCEQRLEIASRSALRKWLYA